MKRKSHHIVFIIAGSNMGHPTANLARAEKKIRSQVGEILKSSALYETAPWGKPDQKNFINQVYEVSTMLDSRSVLDTCLKIEHEMGRIRTHKYDPRFIDIDILFYNNEIIAEDGIAIPHPEIPNRRFVLVPMMEVKPEFIHPVLQKSIKQLLAETKDELTVEKI